MVSDKITITQDGSSTIFSEQSGEHYHSTFGAVQESTHVFIKSGIESLPADLKDIHLLEVGFGSGLNALLAMKWAEKNKRHIHYSGIEAFPISAEMVRDLNYPELLNYGVESFYKMHQKGFEKIRLSKYFSFQKLHIKLEEVTLPAGHFHLIFFDAFSPDAQPELWTVDIFRKIADASKKGAILTTYSCKGIVKRALREAGFSVEKLPGPPGKREIIRAILDRKG